MATDAPLRRRHAFCCFLPNRKHIENTENDEPMLKEPPRYSCIERNQPPIESLRRSNSFPTNTSRASSPFISSKGRIKAKVRKRRSLEGFSRHRSNSAWFTDFGPCYHNIHSYVPDKETSVFLRHWFPRRINVGSRRNEKDAKRQNEWRGTL